MTGFLCRKFWFAIKIFEIRTATKVLPVPADCGKRQNENKMIGLDGKQPVHPRGAPYECVRKKLRNELSRFLLDEVDALHLVAPG